MMKRLAVFLTTLLVLNVQGQDNYRPLLVDGHNWRYQHLTLDGESMTEEQVLNGDPVGYVIHDYVLKVDGDVEFDGRLCKKISCDGLEDTSLYAYGYEEGGKVLLYAFFNEPAFYAPFPTMQWITLYDFTVTKASHCQMGAFQCGDMIVGENGTTEISGSTYDYIGLTDARIPTWPVRYAVEGIGSAFGLFEFSNIITDGSSSRFVGCYDGDKCLFSADDFKSLIVGVQQPKGVDEHHFGGAVYYSPDGKRLPAPQRGLNIVRTPDGTTKKVVKNLK